MSFAFKSVCNRTAHFEAFSVARRLCVTGFAGRVDPGTETVVVHQQFIGEAENYGGVCGVRGGLCGVVYHIVQPGCSGRARTGFYFDSPFGQPGNRYRYFFAFIEWLKESNIQRATIEPFGSKMADYGCGQISIYSDAGNEASAESVFGGEAIVMGLIL